MSEFERFERVAVEGCPGPLVWFDADPGAVLECATCGYVVTSGNFNDAEHAYTSLLRGAA